jgi:hypothetical protein
MIKKSLTLEAAKLAEINVFDFDDTLVKTKSRIYLTTKEGRLVALTPGEYAVYEPQPGDVFDYSEFDELKNPAPIAHMLLKLKYAIRNLGIDNVFILTARGVSGPISRFLEEFGVEGIRIVALGSSDPFMKADVIKDQILTRGVKLVKFFDDSAKNVSAVKSLRLDPEIPKDVQIISVKV